MWGVNNKKSSEMMDIDRMDQLIAENNDLKCRLANMEKKILEKDQKINAFECRLTDLQVIANDQMIELNQLKNRLVNMSSPDKSYPGKERTLEREQTLERLKKKHLDVEKLKAAMESLMITNEEKNVKMDEMKELLKKYKLFEERIRSIHGNEVLMDCGLDGSTTNHIAADVVDLTYPSATSTPMNCHVSNNNTTFHNGHVQQQQQHQSTITTTASTTSASLSALPSPVRPSSSSMSSTSYTNIGQQLKTPPTIKKQVLLPNTNNGNVTAQRTTNETVTTVIGFGDSDGTPGEDDTLKDTLAQEYRAMQVHPTNQDADKKKTSTSRTIRKLFHRLRRSNSQEFDGKMEDFKRSTLRSTAGPRLGWNNNNKAIELNNEMSFGSWDVERISLWLHNMGLSSYVGECRRWIKNGDQLLTATSHDLEKELGMKNAFHRKKLQLALQVVTSDPLSSINLLDHNWVQKWLDDIGLPQYKDQFMEARVDGRMINYLTNDDLQNLKVMSLMHHMSFKCGIQVLRHHNFNPQCLKRRPAANEEIVLQNCPLEVCTWTNHRVMEWLRSIDLSEYSPNLRGSGVHGGLMVLEPRFSADVLAAILSIPSNKTLLRRHLTTHFVSLVGNQVQQLKRGVESEPNYVPLSTNQRVKPSKKIGLFRPRTSELRDDFVCPLHIRSLSWKLESLSSLTPDVLGNKEVGEQVKDHKYGEDLPMSDV